MRHPASRHRGGRLCEPARPAAHRPSALGSELACPHPFACSPAKSPAYPVMSPAHLLSCPAAHLLSYPPAQLPTYSVTHLPGCLPLSCPPTHPPTCSCAHLLSCPHAHHSVAHLFPCPPTLHPLVFSEFSFAQLPACCLSPPGSCLRNPGGRGSGRPCGASLSLGSYLPGPGGGSLYPPKLTQREPFFPAETSQGPRAGARVSPAPDPEGRAGTGPSRPGRPQVSTWCPGAPGAHPLCTRLCLGAPPSPSRGHH